MYSALFSCIVYRFFFNDTATTEIYTLSLHDALPILEDQGELLDVELVGLAPRLVKVLRQFVGTASQHLRPGGEDLPCVRRQGGDRKSTRLNSSHANISYAVFCLKKKKDISMSSSTRM